MKLITGIILLSLIFSACVPSEQAIQTAIAQTEASYTDTPTPTPIPTDTPTPTATPTPDVVFAYFKEYLPYMQEWGEQFESLNDLTQSIGRKGLAVLDDEAFKTELLTTMAKWEATAKNAADISPPNEDLQRFQEMAEELHIQTEIYTNLYILAIATGDDTSTELAIDALNKAGEIFKKISEEIKEGNYIP